MLKDLESQLIWWAVAGGIAMYCWQIDSLQTGGAGGLWFWLSLVPLGLNLYIADKYWEPKEAEYESMR